MIDIKDVITLSDGRKYVVVSKTNYINGRMYYYLIDKDDSGSIKFGYLDNDEFVEINDPELIKKLLPSLYENGKKELPKEILEKLEKLGE